MGRGLTGGTTVSSEAGDAEGEVESGPGAETSPYTLQREGVREGGDDPRHVFWADEVADRIEARRPAEPIVIKGGISPSGVPHLGNVNEILRAYYVAVVLRERGYEVRQVFTADDRDPLRKLPRTLSDLEGNLVDLGDVDAGALGRNLGAPYTDIPDPFGCCDSYGSHFSTLIGESADLVDVPIDLLSTTDLYTSGQLDRVTTYLLANRRLAAHVLEPYQDTVDADYVPFNPICAECGTITETVTAIDFGDGERDLIAADGATGDEVADEGGKRDEGAGKEGTGDGVTDGEGEGEDAIDAVTTAEPGALADADLPDPAGVRIHYRCTDLEAGERTIEGCGHEGVCGVRDGKLPWRFEWPAQWAVLGVDFEPFGKDHAEGSWPSGEDIARNVLGIEPPVPMVYEWFTLDGEPFSSSAGNVILVSDVLELVEPEVVRYFFAKDPSRARDFSVERIDLLVDEFDRFERIHFGETDPADAREGDFAERVYPLVVPEPRPERIRLPYTFAAVLGMADDPSMREAIARGQGHLPADAPPWAVEAALERVERAREWARRTGNEFDYELKRSAIPAHDFDPAVEAALEDLADFVERERPDPETLQGEMYETARRHDLEMGEFFGAGYRLFFGQEEGPKLGEFLGELDPEFVVRRLRREA